MNVTLFMSEEHRVKFEEKRTKLYSGQQKNPEYLSVIYIMTSNPELYEKMGRYFSKDGFKVEKMLEENDFSHGQHIFASLASNLFNDGLKVSPIDMIATLSEESFLVAMNAIYVRKTGAV